MQAQVVAAPAKPIAQQAAQQTMADQKLVANIPRLSEAKVAASGLVEL